MNAIIRPYTPTDVEAMVDIWNQVVEDGIPTIGRDSRGLPHEGWPF